MYADTFHLNRSRLFEVHYLYWTLVSEEHSLNPIIMKKKNIILISAVWSRAEDKTGNKNTHLFNRRSSMKIRFFSRAVALSPGTLSHCSFHGISDGVAKGFYIGWKDCSRITAHREFKRPCFWCCHSDGHSLEAVWGDGRSVLTWPPQREEPITSCCGRWPVCVLLWVLHWFSAAVMRESCAVSFTHTYRTSNVGTLLRLSFFS